MEELSYFPKVTQPIKHRGRTHGRNPINEIYGITGSELSRGEIGNF